MERKNFPWEPIDRIVVCMIIVELNAEAMEKHSALCIELYCDVDGLKLLNNAIERIMAGESHEHLMSPSWAGNELSDSPTHGSSNPVIKSVLIQKIGD